MKSKEFPSSGMQSAQRCSIVEVIIEFNGARRGTDVSLSEHERKLLAQMEEALSADDPHLVSTLTGTRLYPGRNRILLGVALTIVGILTIFAGLITKTTPIGILGFLISLSGVILAISALSGVSALRAPGGTRGNRRRGKMNSRLEDRWERRNFDQ